MTVQVKHSSSFARTKAINKPRCGTVCASQSPDCLRLLCLALAWYRSVQWGEPSLRSGWLALRARKSTSIDFGGVEKHLYYFFVFSCLSLGVLGHGEPALDGCAHLGVLVEQLLDGVVAGDDDVLGPDLEGSTLVLGDEGVPVTPDLEVVTQLLAVEVVEDDGLLALIAIPPFILHLEVGPRILGSGIARLARPGGPPQPLASNALCVRGCHHVVLLDLLQRPVEPQVDIGGYLVQIPVHRCPLGRCPPLLLLLPAGLPSLGGAVAQLLEVPVLAAVVVVRERRTARGLPVSPRQQPLQG